MRRQWDMNQDDFNRFLTWLDPDSEQAGKLYEQFQIKLIRFFICRGCGVDAEELADDTISRVVRNMPRIADTYSGPRLPYFLEVGRRVFLEYLHRKMRERTLRDQTAGDSSHEKETLHQCLDQCLDQLSRVEHDLILGYYAHDRHEKIVHRKELAEKLGLAPNALRIRAHRIRTALRHCLENCLEQQSDDETKPGYDYARPNDDLNNPER